MNKIIEMMAKVNGDNPGIGSVALQEKVCAALGVSRATYYRAIKASSGVTSGNTAKPQAKAQAERAPSETPQVSVGEEKSLPKALVPAPVETSAIARQKVVETPVEDIVEDDFAKLIPPTEKLDSYVVPSNFKDIEAILWEVPGSSFLFEGESGSGKTLSAEMMAARAQVPYLSVSVNPSTPTSALFGAVRAVDGSTFFQPSLMTRLFRRPSVVAIEEINATGEALDFHQVLNDRKFYLKDANRGRGQVFDVHPECRIVFTCNLGYSSTQPVSKALVDRVYVERFSAPSSADFRDYLLGKMGRTLTAKRKPVEREVIAWETEAEKVSKLVAEVASSLRSKQLDGNVSYRMMRKIKEAAPLVGLPRALVYCLVRPMAVLFDSDVAETVYGIVKAQYDVTCTFR